jgi:hypothetical protein
VPVIVDYSQSFDDRARRNLGWLLATNNWLSHFPSLPLFLWTAYDYWRALWLKPQNDLLDRLSYCLRSAPSRGDYQQSSAPHRVSCA